MVRLADVGPSLLVVAVLALGGCGGTPRSQEVGPGSDGGGGGVPIETLVTGLHFTTSSAFPDNPPPTNVDVTLTDATPARAIYVATLALPAIAPGRYNCPADLGYGHTILFLRGAAALATATLNTTGCRDATIMGAPPPRQTSDAYWTLLATNLGVDEASLFSVASP
jgi:hypothetical protein